MITWSVTNTHITPGDKYQYLTIINLQKQFQNAQKINQAFIHQINQEKNQAKNDME